MTVLFSWKEEKYKQKATTYIYFMPSDEKTGSLIVSASLCLYQLKLFQDYQNSLENIYSGSQILTVEIRNGRKKSKLVISNVPESQRAYFPFFLLLTTFHTSRQSCQTI